MRIILLVSALIGAAAAAGAAQAQWSNGGRGGGSHGGWNGGGGPAVDGFRYFRPDRHHRRHGRHDRRRGGFVGLYGGGLAGDFEAVERHGTGFFAAGGGRVSVEGGRPLYDYDRSYPYEWASAAAPDLEGEPDGRSPPSCALEKGVRVCRGGR